MPKRRALTRRSQVCRLRPAQLHRLPPALRARAQRVARTEQCKGPGRTPQTRTSTWHQINHFYWFPRGLPLRQVSLPWNAPACPGSGADKARPALGARCPGAFPTPAPAGLGRRGRNPNSAPGILQQGRTLLQLRCQPRAGERLQPPLLGAGTNHPGPSFSRRFYFDKEKAACAFRSHIDSSSPWGSPGLTSQSCPHPKTAGKGLPTGAGPPHNT